MVDEYIRSSAHRNLACSLVDRYRLEGFNVVHVDRLKELLRSPEDDERMAGDICLGKNTTGS